MAKRGDPAAFTPARRAEQVTVALLWQPQQKENCAPMSRACPRVHVEACPRVAGTHFSIRRHSGIRRPVCWCFRNKDGVVFVLCRKALSPASLPFAYPPCNRGRRARGRRHAWRRLWRTCLRSLSLSGRWPGVCSPRRCASSASIRKPDLVSLPVPALSLSSNLPGPAFIHVVGFAHCAQHPRACRGLSVAGRNVTTSGVARASSPCLVPTLPALRLRESSVTCAHSPASP